MTTQKNSLIKHCRVCDCKLTIDFNWTQAMQKYRIYLCKNCKRTIANEWNRNNRDKRLVYDNRWKRSNVGKVRGYVANHKRNLDWIELFENPFDGDIPVDGHHISDAFVVYIPRSLHQIHHGSNTKQHRKELKPFIESIYDISYIIT